jgi:hypothetical protein
MSDMQNFSDIPTHPLDFISRIRLSMQTALRFLVDQKWASLIFLLVYLGLIYWDFIQPPIENPDIPDWMQDWPEYMSPLKGALAQQMHNSWRSVLASFLTALFWGNALLHIADQSAAFDDQSVVGLVRYLLRGAGIAILLFIPAALGFLLFIIPGLWISAILMTAGTLSMFREQGIFRAIGAGYRVVTDSLPGQQRVLGFSRSFQHIITAYALDVLCSSALFGTTLLVTSILGLILPSLKQPLSFLQIVVSNLGSSFFNIVLSIFILRLYAEHRTLVALAPVRT